MHFPLKVGAVPVSEFLRVQRNGHWLVTVELIVGSIGWFPYINSSGKCNSWSIPRHIH